MDVDDEESKAEGEEDVPPVPPPPPGGFGPSERRARVAPLPPPPDDGPTYYRLGIDYPLQENEEVIHIQCGRIKKLENLEVVGPRLKKLELVASCIEKIENLDTNVNLVHLELYQNLVKKIDNIGHLTQLENLDLSFNKIRSCESLGNFQFDKLERLYLSSNKITDIEGVFQFKKIQMLEFGSNRVRGIPPQLSELTLLRELWLGKNKIVSMALPPLPSLQKLSLQNNRLEVWDPSLFQNAPGLTHVYFGHNNLPDLPEEFALLTELVELDLARNAITKVRPIPELHKLEELWMNDCQITDIAEVRHLASFTGLKTIYLERNPFHGLGNPESEERYKTDILAAVPHVTQLDALRLNHSIQVISDGTERNVRGIRKR